MTHHAQGGQKLCYGRGGEVAARGKKTGTRVEKGGMRATGQRLHNAVNKQLEQGAREDPPYRSRRSRRADHSRSRCNCRGLEGKKMKFVLGKKIKYCYIFYYRLGWGVGRQT